MNKIVTIRESIGRIVHMLSEKKINVTQRGTRAFVKWNKNDGSIEQMNIPYIPDDATPEFIGAVQGFLDHEAAHVLHSDFKVIKKANELKVARMHNIIDDAYIELRQAEQFPGSRINLAHSAEFFLKTFTDVELKKGEMSPNAILIVPAIRAWAGQTIFQDYMEDKWHLIQDVVDRLGDSVNALKDMKRHEDTLKIAQTFTELLKEPPSDDGDSGDEGEGKSKKKGEKSKDKKESGKAESDDESSDDRDAEEGEGEGEGEGGESGESDGDSPEGDGGDSDDDAEGEPDDREPDDSTKPSSGKKKGNLLKEIEDAPDYDEELSKKLSEVSKDEAKKADYIVYTTDYDKIEPLDIEKYTRGFTDRDVSEMQNKVDHMVGPIQKDLERIIAARSLSTFTSGHKSGRLNSGALARLTTFKDDRAFRRKHERISNNVAVTLLVDCSGSMTNSNKIVTASYAAYALSSVLERIRVANEVLGFSAHYHDIPGQHSEEKKTGVRYSRQLPLYMPILKSFTDKLGTVQRRNIAALKRGEEYLLQENVDGECIQIAAKRLLQRNEARKIMIVLSDGNPACPGDRGAQQEHLKKTVEDVAKSGVEIVGIGINSDVVKRFYKNHIVINNVSELPTIVIKELKKLLLK